MLVATVRHTVSKRQPKAQLKGNPKATEQEKPLKGEFRPRVGKFLLKHLEQANLVSGQVVWRDVVYKKKNLLVAYRSPGFIFRCILSLHSHCILFAFSHCLALSRALIWPHLVRVSLAKNARENFLQRARESIWLSQFSVQNSEVISAKLIELHMNFI